MRTCTIDWFWDKDVAKILGYKVTTNAFKDPVYTNLQSITKFQVESVFEILKEDRQFTRFHYRGLKNQKMRSVMYRI